MAIRKKKLKVLCGERMKKSEFGSDLLREDEKIGSCY